MSITRLDHYNFDTALPEETIRFYTEVLGLVNAPERRPDFGVDGTWILVGEHPAIHVNFVATPRGGSDTGAIDHIAFQATDSAPLEAAFRQHGIDFKRIDHPAIPLTQLFARDPNGIRIEINVPG